MPTVTRPKRMRTHNAHEAVEFAKTVGKANEMNEALYRALWEEGREINQVDVIRDLAASIVPDVEALIAAVESRAFKHKIVGFDDPAYDLGIYNVPTFFIGEDRLVEQPYSVLRSKVANQLGLDPTDAIYLNLAFPAATQDRPYVYLNMVTTIDGKILSGERNEPVHDLGSARDHRLMQLIEGSADAVIVGAQTLRSTSKNWNPKPRIRLVVSSHGDLPYDAKFFTEGEAYVVSFDSAPLKCPSSVKTLRVGKDSLDLRLFLSKLKSELGVERLLGMGGSELNAQLLKLDLVDELFWTVAPKVKLGRDVPTYADGEPLDRASILRFEIVEQHVVNNELFVRYRRSKTLGH